MGTASAARSNRWLGWLTVLSLAAGGCATQRAGAPREAHSAMSRPGWVAVAPVPLVLQTSDEGCGAAALSAVLAFWGYPVGHVEGELRRERGAGLLAGGLERYVHAVGLSAIAFYGTIEDVVYELDNGRPVIVGVAERRSLLPRYEVVVAYEPSGRQLLTLDPARGWTQRSFDGFLEDWDRARRLPLVVFGAEPSLPATPPMPRSPRRETSRR